MIDPARRAELVALREAGREHDAQQADRLDRLRNVEPETADLLYVLALGLRARRILELGTSNGYSTCWLAAAAEELGGRVITVELEAQRTEQARENLARLGLDGVVELRTGDAGDQLAGATDASADLIFLDAERPLYTGYWPDLVRVLASPGLLVVDNAISHAEEMAEFRALVEDDSRLALALVPVGAGILVVSRAGSAQNG